MSHLDRTLFLASPPRRCAYLPAREAVSLFANPRAGMDSATYGRLIDAGFRRSGQHVYRPYCQQCTACVPTRIPVERFAPDRSQRRNQALNGVLDVHMAAPVYCAEHFILYRRYLRHRHAGGDLDDLTPADYRAFLCSGWADTAFIEFRLHGELLAIAVSDRLPQGLSAVYTFFAPEHSGRGLGVYAVLWQIEEARRQGLDYVYLGYWIAANDKMNYKTRFRPIEGLVDGEWRELQTRRVRHVHEERLLE